MGLNKKSKRKEKGGQRADRQAGKGWLTDLLDGGGDALEVRLEVLLAVPPRGQLEHHLPSGVFVVVCMGGGWVVVIGRL